MEGLNRITFFKSYWDFIDQMNSLEDKYSLVEGICKYAFYGEKTNMTPAAAAAFVLILPYLEKSMRRAANGKAGAAKTNGKQSGKTVGKQSSKQDAKEETGKKKEEPERRKEENPLSQAGPDSSPKGRASIKKSKFGEYGWVLLSDEQRQRLLTDLGEDELSRCIRYVDESAQKTGNKNGWKDWNLVIRSCHRDGWHRRAERRQSYGSGGLSGASAKQEQDWDIHYD